LNGRKPNRFLHRPWLGAITTLIVVAGVAELALRLAPPQALRFAHDSRAVYRYHPRWRTDFVPNATAAIRWRVDEGWVLNFLVTTNEYGFRWYDRTIDHPLRRVPGQMIVHAVGDSFTMGWGVNYEASYPAYLQRNLGSDALVLNLGLNAYGTVGATEKSIVISEVFPPDVVVYLATDNDYEDDVVARRFSEYPGILRMALDGFDVLRRHFYLANVGHALRWWLYYRDVFAPRDEPEEPGAKPGEITESVDDGPSESTLGVASKNALRSFADRLQERGVPLIVLTHGTGPVAGDLARFCREHGIEVHHLAVPPALHLYREGHFNALGNERLAGVVSKLIHARVAPQNTNTSVPDNAL
jgi:hypothetical protein